MTVELAALTPDLFDTEAPIVAYVITLAPEEDGVLVTLQARTGDELIPAETVAGLTLTTPDGTVPVTGNGII